MNQITRLRKDRAAEPVMAESLKDQAYEAIKEKGSMVIVPSSAVETMGLGGMLATASVGGARVVE